jgi:hypothetical protein
LPDLLGLGLIGTVIVISVSLISTFMVLSLSIVPPGRIAEGRVKS